MEGGGNSSSSSARTAPEPPSSVLPDGSPAFSPGSSASSFLYGSLAAGRRKNVSMAAIGGFTGTPLKAGAWETASRRFEADVSQREVQLKNLTLTQASERQAL